MKVDKGGQEVDEGGQEVDRRWTVKVDRRWTGEDGNVHLFQYNHSTNSEVEKGDPNVPAFGGFSVL
jgi:hypothetical protein